MRGGVPGAYVAFSMTMNEDRNALISADASARERDFKGALRWLEVVEDLELYLPTDYELRRISWQQQAAGAASRAPIGDLGRQRR